MDDVQVETLQRLARVETKIDGIEDKLDAAINAKDVAIEALASAKSAHHRIQELEDSQRWFRRTVAASIITVVVGAIVAFIKLGG